MAALRYEIFHSLAALTHEIFFSTQREISYLHTANSNILYRSKLVTQKL